MAASTTVASAGCTVTDGEHTVAEACPGLDSSGVRHLKNFRILWISVQVSLAMLVLIRSLRFRLAARIKLTRPSAAGAGTTTTMTASRVADIIAMIDEHTVAGTMSGERVAAFCAMINAHCHDDGGTEILHEGYKLMRRLGKGGCGRVVMAQRRSTGQTVAVKTIHARRGARRPDTSELLKEACFLAACRGHPYLVGLHGVVRDPRSREYCLVMDYVGPSLNDHLNTHVEEHGRGFPEAYVRRVMRQLLTGAAAMHERGIIHRDIKPTNILVGDDDLTVKLCDYGCAMPIAKAVPPYGLIGTVPYMAPEMLLEKPDYDERVDSWSLGCVMAELLSGEELFPSVKTTDALRKIFDALGMPGKKTWQGFKSTPPADKVQQWRARRQEAQRKDRLRELFPEELLSSQGFHVLKGLLTCNPGKRLTVAAALRCPWFRVDAPGTDDASGSRSGGTELARHTASCADHRLGKVLQAGSVAIICLAH
uniref:Uncharacterized protein n=1 Tax=Avena sativa TaxID=4498 RepID=A0ACD5YX18_AVESA